MRDPLGRMSFETDRVVRHLNSPVTEFGFLSQQTARELVDSQKLVEYRFQDDVTLVSPKVPFVSYPHEWCNAQLDDAARLTLDIGELCEKNGWELKDASAWNVIFNGTVPIFCDHLSFQKITKKNWWAFGQFVRHFVLPLCISKYAGINANDIFKFNRDGLIPEQARKILGVRRYLTRYWPLLLSTKFSPVATTSEGTSQETSETHVDLESKNKNCYHKNLFSLLRFFLAGSKTKQKKSIWSEYAGERSHYDAPSQDLKSQTINKWLKQTHPAWVTDLGCNTGEYSRLAAENGAKVIAIDLDHESVERLYRTSQGNVNIFPVVANLDDIAGGRGWAGKEFAGLAERIAQVSEMTLMLALIHHLAISISIPYSEIAKFAHSITQSWLIVEMLDHTDPLVKHLSQQRDRQAEEFTLARQVEAFETYFDTLEICAIPGTSRQIRLLKVRK